jgi:hypothetical protein
MRKRGQSVFFVFLLILIFSIFFVAAANDTSTKAYSCLESKVADKCATLTSEEKIFSLLAIDRCKSELLSDSLGGECWPHVGCKIKTTSQAILALNRVNADTLNAEKWLLSQSALSSDLDWFLQADSEVETSCTVTYSGGSYTFTIDGDKTLSGNTGTCLKIYNSYWLKISPTCYDSEFQISCRESFLTSLLYKKKTSSTVYVSQKTNSASAEGTTTEKVGSSCFKEGTSCNYEGTLWAAVVLDYRKYDVSAYIPYLVAMADENSKYLPEAFLYSLTDSFRTELLTKQVENKWWSASGDKFYDTAVALLPFQNEQLSEKTNSIDWLSEVQGTDGCWQGNIRNTAFLLYSIWPKKISLPSTAKDCEDSGYNCISNAACEDAFGTLLTDYTGCFGTNICCSKPRLQETCSQQNGEVCDSDEECLGGSTVSSSDISGGESCCIDGECGAPEPGASECELMGGYCKSTCSGSEEYSSYSCSSGNCCIQKAGGANILLIIILSALILLVLIGIIFRKKLRAFFSKRKLKKGRPPSGIQFGRPRFFPPPSRRIYPGAVQRRIIPQARQPAQPLRQPARQPAKPVKQPAQPAKPAAKSAKKSEVEDVLKKLKEIGK